MYEGFEIIDFHAHFPTDQPWFPDMGDTMKNYIDRVGERRFKLIQERGKPYGEHWRRMLGFPRAEERKDHLRLWWALNPEHFIAVRKGPGGVAPEATAALLDELLADLEKDRVWLDAAEQRLAQASRQRQRNAQDLLGAD